MDRKSVDPGVHKIGAGVTTTTATGDVVARIATLSVIDLDGDVVMPGCIPPSGAPVVIGAWNHGTMQDAPPIGAGVIREEGDALILRGRLFMELQSARDHHVILRARGGEQEWSWAFQIKDSKPGTHLGQRVRFLNRVDIMEASPVVRGAGGPGRTGTVELHGMDPSQLAAERSAAEAIRRSAAPGRLTKDESDLVVLLGRARSLGIKV